MDIDQGDGASGTTSIDYKYNLSAGSASPIDYGNNDYLNRSRKGIPRRMRFNITVEQETAEIQIPVEPVQGSPVYILPVGSEFDQRIRTVTIAKRANKSIYYPMNFLGSGGLNTSSTTIDIASGDEFLQIPKENEDVFDTSPSGNSNLILFDNGEPIIIFADDAPTGSEVEVSITTVNALALSSSTDSVELREGEFAMPSKQNRYKYVANLSKTILPGDYTIQYNARVFYDKGFDQWD